MIGVAFDMDDVYGIGPYSGYPRGGANEAIRTLEEGGFSEQLARAVQHNVTSFVAFVEEEGAGLFWPLAVFLVVRDLYRPVPLNKPISGV